MKTCIFKPLRRIVSVLGLCGVCILACLPLHALADDPCHVLRQIVQSVHQDWIASQREMAQNFEAKLQNRLNEVMARLKREPYRLLEYLGGGNEGTVFLTSGRHEGRAIAVKFYYEPSEAAAGMSALEQLTRSPHNLLVTLAFWFDANSGVMAKPYIEGMLYRDFVLLNNLIYQLKYDYGSSYSQIRKLVDQKILRASDLFSVMTEGQFKLLADSYLMERLESEYFAIKNAALMLNPFFQNVGRNVMYDFEQKQWVIIDVY